jgi:NADH:ubiquinone oxidoreductase subunit K
LVAIVRVVVTGVVLVGVSELGLNVQVAKAGSPLQANVVGATNPFTGVSVIVIVEELPAVIVPVEALNVIEKSGGGAVIVTVVAVDTDAASLLSPP